MNGGKMIEQKQEDRRRKAAYVNDIGSICFLKVEQELEGRVIWHDVGKRTSIKGVADVITRGTYDLIEIDNYVARGLGITETNLKEGLRQYKQKHTLSAKVQA